MSKNQERDQIFETYGKLKEGVHLAGYSFARASKNLLWMLKERRFEKVGNFKKGDASEFVRAISLGDENVQIIADNRKDIVAQIKALEPEVKVSNRAIAKAMRVHSTTIDRDAAKAAGGTKKSKASKGRGNGGAAKAAGPSGAAAAAMVEQKTTKELLSQSDQNDWRTPRKFLDAARQVMKGIDLDPASSAEANKTVCASKFYTEKDDGLKLPWKGRLWLNPPYGGEARLFIERLVREYQVGNVTAACALLNSHPTETKWFQALFDYTICFVAGRIDFGGPSREVSTTSTHGSAVVYLGKDIPAFVKAFGEFGAVVGRIK